jgi:hypothetical protein
MGFRVTHHQEFLFQRHLRDPQRGPWQAPRTEQPCTLLRGVDRGTLPCTLACLWACWWLPATGQGGGGVHSCPPADGLPPEPREMVKESWFHSAATGTGGGGPGPTQ